MVRCGLSEVVTISKNALLLLCVKSSTPEKGSATFDFASRAGLTPSPTCLPGQGGSRKGMRPLRQRNGSHECQPSSVKPMEGFSMSNRPNNQGDTKEPALGATVGQRNSMVQLRSAQILNFCRFCGPAGRFGLHVHCACGPLWRPRFGGYCSRCGANLVKTLRASEDKVMKSHRVDCAGWFSPLTDPM